MAGGQSPRTFRGPAAWGTSDPSSTAPANGPFVTTAASPSLSNETLIGAIILPPDTEANKPAASSVVAGGLFYSTDLGRVYRSSGSAWADYSARSGQVVAGPVAFATQFDIQAVGTTFTDVTGASITVPTLAVPFDIMCTLPLIQATTGTAAAAALMRLQWRIIDGSSVAVNGAAGSNTFQQVTASSTNPQQSCTLVAKCTSSQSNQTFKLQVKLVSAAPANWTACLLNPASTTAFQPELEAIAR